MQYEHFDLAHTYATAFLNSCYPTPGTVPVDVIKKLSLFFNRHSSLIGLLGHCLCASPENHGNISEFFAQKFGCSEKEWRIFKTLKMHRNILLLPMVLDHIIIVEDQRLGTEHFEVETSHTLEDNDFTQLTAAIRILAHKYGITNAKINKPSQINTDLICGIRVYSQKYIYEQSVRHVLKHVKKSVKQLGGLW